MKISKGHPVVSSLRRSNPPTPIRPLWRPDCKTAFQTAFALWKRTHKPQQTMAERNISILIPCFNRFCVPLVKTLHDLAAATQSPRHDAFNFEIIVADDKSSRVGCVEANREINALPHCRLLEMDHNVGRAEIRNVLADFLFTGDDVFKRISDLSGGERGRVSLAKLMLSEANFLILDEPTNHLDILSKEILEQALNRYTGTVFYVSHDRYFINQTATRILELTGNTLVNYIGNYDYYLEKKDELTKIYVPSATEEETASLPSSSAETAGKLTWQQQKEEQARIRKRQNELKKTEDRIHVLEVRDKEIDELMMQEEVFTNVAKCVELNKEKTAVNEELEQLYEHWEELAE